MELTVGAILEGKVKSITNFGAFVSLPENKTGMVHISEVANAYVSDIRQHLTEGQDVKVMVIGTENGKINLSIKRLEPKPQRENNGGNFQRREGGFQRRENGNFQRRESSGFQPRENQSQGQNRPQRAPVQPAAPKTADQLFEEKLKAFMTESDSKLSGIRQYADHGSKRRRR
nr:S1 RNA-binding domain-containing protein [Oscillospiraceae bacterium]